MPSPKKKLAGCSTLNCNAGDMAQTKLFLLYPSVCQKLRISLNTKKNRYQGETQYTEGKKFGTRENEGSKQVDNNARGGNIPCENVQ